MEGLRARKLAKMTADGAKIKRYNSTLLPNSLILSWLRQLYLPSNTAHVQRILLQNIVVGLVTRCAVVFYG